MASSSSSNEIVLASSPDGPIIAYDPFSGEPLARFTGSQSSRRGLTLAGKSFIAASHISSTTACGSIHLYNSWSSNVFHNLPVPEPVAPLSATSDGSYIFAGGISGNIYALSLPSGDVLNSVPAHTKPVSCLKISDDESLLISGGDDGTILVFPIFPIVETPRIENPSNFVLFKFGAHDDSVTAITSCMWLCNSTIVSCSLDCTCKFWCLSSGTHLQTVVFPCTIQGVALHPTETEFYAAGSDGSVYHAKQEATAQGYKIAQWAQKHGATILSIEMVNRERNLVSASEDGNLKIWNVENGQIVLNFCSDYGTISDMVVASGLSFRSPGKMHVDEGNGQGSGFGSNEMRREVNELIELEEVLKVAAEDRSKAIDMLESAIEMYEKLLELILKEVKKGRSNTEEKPKN